jgi:hypothetical protein
MAMFDGTLPRDDGEPAARMVPARSAWSRELVALLLAVTIISILGAALFPEAMSYAGTRF